MTAVRTLLVAVTLTSLVSLSCKSSCRQLSEKLCDCTTNTNDKNACLQLAASKESANPPLDSDNRYCATLVDQCDCRLIDTTNGKIRCGLAYPLDGGATRGNAL